MNSSFLHQHQLKLLSHALDFLYEEPPDREVLDHVIDTMERLVPQDSVSVELFLSDGLGMRHLTDRRLEIVPHYLEALPAIISDHPTIRHLERSPSTKLVRMSDFVTQRQFRETNIYNVTAPYQPMRDQVGLMVPTGIGVIGFAINRDKVFSDEERLMLCLLHPHVTRVLNWNARFAHLETITKITARERDVLHWITLGKTDGEIAAILGNRARTVNSQVRSILAKLHAENRVNAAMMVRSNRPKFGPITYRRRVIA